ncbi:MAG: hypothetical protein ACXVB7_22535 [Ktedonobacteraceae bacterium]
MPKKSLFVRKLTNGYFEHIIEGGQLAGAFQLNVDPKIVSFGILGMCNWMSQWYSPDGQFTYQHVSTMFANIIANGLCL